MCKCFRHVGGACLFQVNFLQDTLDKIQGVHWTGIIKLPNILQGPNNANVSFFSVISPCLSSALFGLDFFYSPLLDNSFQNRPVAPRPVLLLPHPCVSYRRAGGGLPTKYTCLLTLDIQIPKLRRYDFCPPKTYRSNNLLLRSYSPGCLGLQMIFGKYLLQIRLETYHTQGIVGCILTNVPRHEIPM